MYRKSAAPQKDVIDSREKLGRGVYLADNPSGPGAVLRSGRAPRTSEGDTGDQREPITGSCCASGGQLCPARLS